ncbi:MAG: oleate hydratase [Myxococcales bacterium]|nr:oleate hydratase [Myxococcales bacterium]
MAKESFGMRWVRKRLGGYKQQINTVSAQEPKMLSGKRRVAVIGGGIAGISSASHLAERGYSVVLFEKESYLGGKVGSWLADVGDGVEMQVEHGFHAFFRQYYNLLDFLRRIGADKHLKPIDDYLILTREHGNFSFQGIHTTPIYNLLSMARKGIYSLPRMALNPKSQKMRALLQFEPESTFAMYDHVSFAEFAKAAALPDQLIRIFTSFARAFFSEPSKMSMAEMMKGFHFYFLSNDLGLLYDYMDEDFAESLLVPICRHLEAHGVQWHLETPVESIEREGTGYRVNGEAFDDLVIATDVVGTRRITEACSWMRDEAPSLAGRLSDLRPSQRYAVLRLWLDRDVRPDLPIFLFTDREVLLDSISLYHRMQETSARWVEEHGGSVIELHSYAVPDHIADQEEARALLIREFEDYFPEIKGAVIRHEYMQFRQDFASFTIGQYAQRPEVQTEIPNLLLAGDWVRLPCPVMLMEAAHTSGMMAANTLLSAQGLQEYPIYSIPLRGLLAPRRKEGLRLLAAAQQGAAT